MTVGKFWNFKISCFEIKALVYDCKVLGPLPYSPSSLQRKYDWRNFNKKCMEAENMRASYNFLNILETTMHP